jgi:hypothetical protein
MQSYRESGDREELRKSLISQLNDYNETGNRVPRRRSYSARR